MALGQLAIACGCGSDNLVRSGLCPKCERRARLNREKFEGLREAALRRDDGQCQTCGERDPDQVLVHHRRPGVNRLRFLITLCRGCHVRVHHTRRPAYAFGGLLRELWREVNRGPEQRRLAFLGAPVAQIDLFQKDAA